MTECRALAIFILLLGTVFGETPEDPLIGMFKEQKNRLSSLESSIQQLVAKIESLGVEMKAHSQTQYVENNMLKNILSSKLDSFKSAVSGRVDSEVRALKRKLTEIETRLARVEHCPQGFFDTGIGCYRYNALTMSRSAAAAYCSSIGSSLVAFETKTEWLALKKWMKGLKYWTAGNDAFTERVWYWTWGTTGLKIGFSNWMTGEPNNSGNEDCLEVLETGYWNDGSCSRRLPFVCEVARS